MRFGFVSAMALGLLAAACADSYQPQRAALEVQHTHARLAALSPSAPNRPVNIPAPRPLMSVSDSVPSINVEQVCQGIADQGTNFHDYKADHDSAKRDCLDSEVSVRGKLERVWKSFNASDQNHCVTETSMGGESSYTELLTCLEMAADVRKLHEEADRTRRAQSVNLPDRSQ